MLIRAMTLDDCAALEALQQDPHLAIDPRVELASALSRAWVACETASDPPLGYALGWWVLDELQLLAFGVLAQARRRGVGGRLLQRVLADVTAAGGRRVLLEVAVSNTAAIQLYERAGFRVYNVRPRYYRETGDDALEMELALAAGG